MLAQEASVLAASTWVSGIKHPEDSTRQHDAATLHLSPSAVAVSTQLVAGLQRQALTLSAELQESRSQLQALWLRTGEREQGKEIALAMAKAAEEQSDLNLNEVSVRGRMVMRKFHFALDDEVMIVCLDYCSPNECPPY